MKTYFTTILILAILLMGGCTFTFKGTDVEADGQVVKIYDLEKVEIFKRGTQSENDQTWRWQICDSRCRPVPRLDKIRLESSKHLLRLDGLHDNRQRQKQMRIVHAATCTQSTLRRNSGAFGNKYSGQSKKQLAKSDP